MEFETCEVTVIDKEKVDAVKLQLPDDLLISEISDYFKIFSDPTRLKILYSLLENELCVCDLSALAGMSISAVSHQLRYLKTTGVVKSVKAGKLVFYSLSSDFIKFILLNAKQHDDYKK